MAGLPRKLSLQRPTALDILDLLRFAALECFSRRGETVQEELLLDRQTCVRLVAFVHCNSLVDCSEKTRATRPTVLTMICIFIYVFRAPRPVRFHHVISPSACAAANDPSRHANIFAWK